MATDIRFLQDSVGRSAQMIAALLDQIAAAAAALPQPDSEAGGAEPEDLEARLEVFWRVSAEELRTAVGKLAASASWQPAHDGKKGRG